MKTRMMAIVTSLGLGSWTAALALSPGDQVPDITVPSTGSEPVNLRQVEGWKVVYFYPKSFTPGCTTQACGLRDSSSQYETLKATVFGVSTDNLETQHKFKEKHNLPFDLLADNKKELSKAFNVLGLMGFSKRVTFIINPQGVITDVLDSVSVGSHDQDVAQLLATHQQAE